MIRNASRTAATRIPLALAGLAVSLAIASSAIAGEATCRKPEGPPGPGEVSIRFYVPEGVGPLAGATPSSAENERRSVRCAFRLPDECALYDDFSSRYEVAADYQIEINQLIGVSRYCDFEREMGDYPATAAHDHISNVDLGSLPLDLAPWQLHGCGDGSAGNIDWFDFCSEVDCGIGARTGAGPDASCLDHTGFRGPAVCGRGTAPGRLSYVRFFSDADPPDYEFHLDCTATEIDHESCRLRGGSFIGSLALVDGRVTCKHDPETRAGVALLPVRYRDVNADGFLDAVLRWQTQHGGSAAGGNVRQYLTRRSPDGPIEIIWPDRRDLFVAIEELTPFIQQIRPAPDTPVE